MSDPLSIASAVAGLVSLTIEATKLTCKYVGEGGHAGDTVLQCQQSLAHLRDVLARVQESSTNSELAAILQQRPQLISEDEVKSCTQSIEKVRGRLAALFHDDGRIKKRHAFTWPFKNTESADLIKQLQAFRDMFAALIAADTLDVSVKSHQIATETRSVVWDIKDDVASGRRNKASHHLLNWIYPDNMETWRFGGDRENSCQGTGAWFFESDTFQDWIRSRDRGKPALWCVGPPGSGKSVLMSQAVSHIQGQLSPISGLPEALVLSHFCDHRDSQTQSPDVIIRHLMRQAALQSDKVLANLQNCKEYQETKKSGRGLRLEKLVRIFLDECLAFDSRFLVVLDGLDECAEELAGLDARREVLQFIAKAATMCTRILEASRDLADIRAELDGCSSELKVRAPDADMRAYVMGRLQGVEKRVARAQSFKEAIVGKVIEDADGIFLLARLMLDILAPSSIKNIRQIKMFLEEPHCDLTKMYQETLDRILSNNEATADLARKALLWLCYTQRPLRESELQHALATEIDDDDFDMDGITPGELVQACCMGIVVCDSEGIYSLFHQTAYEFFCNSPELGSAAAHLLISKTCLCYLSFSTIRDQGSCQSLEALESRRNSLSLLDYAAKHWADHARQVEDDIVDSIISFITDDVLRQCLDQCFYYRKRDDTELQQMMFATLPTGSTALQVACGSGLPVTAERLLAEDKDAKSVAQADDQGWTPLIVASSYGHLQLIDILLEHADTVDPIATDSWDEDPEARDTEEKGVISLNKADEAGWTPLFWAVIKGNRAVVEKLLAARACTSLQDESNWTPIDWAVFRADRPIATLLVQYMSLPRPYIHLRPPGAFSAIFLAAAAGDNQTVESLLQHGTTASISASSTADKVPRFLSKEERVIYAGYSYRDSIEYNNITVPSLMMTASFTVRLFESAIRFDQLAIVKMLVELDLPLSAVKGELKDRSALHIAACCGNRRICEYLISKGADTTLQDVDGHTPLDLAITVAAIPCIKLFLGCVEPRSTGISRLIDRGNAPAGFLYGWEAKINIRKYNLGKSKNTSWFRSEAHMRQDSLNMLEASKASTAIDPSAYILSRNNANDLTAIHDDSDSDDNDDTAIEVLRALLDRGCDVNATGRSDDEIPLNFAYKLSKFKLVSFLLQNGADVNITKPNYERTPLIIACATHLASLDVVQALVQGGADLNAINKSVGEYSALFAACFNAPAEIVVYLIASGAHVNIYDELERHPLHIICCRSLTNPATRDGIVELIEHVLDLLDPDILSRACYYDVINGTRATVLDFAIGAENWAAADFLCSRGAAAPNTTIVSRVLWDQATNPRGNTFNRLVSEYGADPSALVDDTPIITHCLAKYCYQNTSASDGFEDNLVALMEAGADINAVGMYMYTALHFVVYQKMDLEFMRILLQHGAKPRISPNWWQNEIERYEEIMAILLKFAPLTALAKE